MHVHTHVHLTQRSYMGMRMHTRAPTHAHAAGPNGPGGGPGPQLPGGWTWRQAAFVALGFALTLPLFNAVKERIVGKVWTRAFLWVNRGE